MIYVRDYAVKKLVTNLIIFNYTHGFYECQKNLDKLSENRTDYINYTHNFYECQKNLQKILKFLKIRQYLKVEGIHPIVRYLRRSNIFKCCSNQRQIQYIHEAIGVDIGVVFSTFTEVERNYS